MQATGSNTPQAPYRLSIHARVDGFSVYAYSQPGQLLWQHDHASAPSDSPQAKADALRTALLDKQVAQHTYEQVELVAHTPSTYVPVELFRRSDMASLYRLTFSSHKAGNADIRHRILPSLDVVEIFAVSSHLAAVVSELYPQAQILGRAGQVVCQCAEADRRRTDGERHLYVRQDTQLMHICLMHNAQLRFACTYPATTDADRIYYLLAVWKNLALDAQKTACLASGISDSFRQEINNYILNIETCA